MKNYKSKKRDLHQEVTNKIITLIEQGVTPWRRTWSQYGQARNYVSGHIYTGINALLMNLTGHSVPYFLTFNQAKKLGGHIRKGAKSEQVYFYKTLKIENIADDGSSEAKTIPLLKCYNVFNIADVEGVDFEITGIDLKENEVIENCETILNGMPGKPDFVHENANEAYYTPSRDCINMPKIEQFDSSSAYYATFFHELTHSTGHAKRLNREGVTGSIRFGSSDYSKEELIAEMGASFLCAHAGINHEEIEKNSAAYLKGWLGKLRSDKKLIFKAATQAQSAFDFILNIQRQYES